MHEDSSLASTGIRGLDAILGGGLTRNRLYLFQGNPGSGKTTAALQFLMEGARAGEPGLYVTLSETREELIAVARSHQWSLDGLHIYELAVLPEAEQGDYTLFHPSEVELSHTTQGVLEQVQRLEPQRIVFDSLSEMRLLARDPLRYRRQILSLKQYFIGRRCTVLLLDDRTTEPTDLQLESLAHGVVDLEQLAPEYGAERRRLRVKKMRGLSYRGGFHDFRIATGGLEVFPRLVAAEHRTEYAPAVMSSGSAELDALLGGGVDRGTSLLVMGPAGAGKSSIALSFALCAAARGEGASYYAFDENADTIGARAHGLGWDIDTALATGRLRLQRINPAELSPGQFAHEVCRAVDEDDARIVVIDSLNGYMSAMPDEHHLSLHLHELLSVLGHRGVASILVMAQHGLVGSAVSSGADVSYLADTVIVLRHFESHGAMRTAASVLKRRTGGHERTLREFTLGRNGLRVGAPLREFRGILSGVPTHTGDSRELMEGRGADHRD